MNPIDKAIIIILLACVVAFFVLVWVEHAEGGEDDPFILYPTEWNEVTGYVYDRDYLPPSEHPCRTPSVYVSECERYWVLTELDFYKIGG